MKHKARIFAHGGQQIFGVNYWDTYSQVVNWISVRFFLTIFYMYKLESESIDFVLAFPQAELEVDFYMEIHQGMEVAGANGPQVQKLIKNLYGLKQASHN